MTKERNEAKRMNEETREPLRDTRNAFGDEEISEQVTKENRCYVG